MEEKRKFRRTPTKEKAFLQDKEQNKPRESHLMDVSSGGMRILSDTNIKVGSPLSGQFKIIPTSGNFYVTGEVIWVKPKTEGAQMPAYEIGIKFNKVSTISEH